MRDDLLGLLERADLALGSAAEVVEAEKLASLIDAVTSVRHRLAYPEDVIVVALAGGTGSGKSSLFNVITGADLVDVGGVRPTTSRPAAAVPGSVGSAMDGYLDRLGVDERYVYDGPPFCLIDLPDTDSVEVDHRHRVEVILPLVDIVVWVVDPEKYRDARLHDDYLKPMSAYSPQFVFALNQIDRLDTEQVEEVVDDLGVALEEDWIEEAVIVPVASTPPSGPPIGLDDLVEVLELKRADRAVLYGKLLTDIANASHGLEADAGGSLDFDIRAAEAVRAASNHLKAGDSTAATDVLTKFLDRLAAESGGVTAEKLEAFAADVPAHVGRIHTKITSTTTPVKRRWFRRSRSDRGEAPDPDMANLLLSEAVIRPARAILARRAVAAASVAELAVAVESLRRSTSR